MSTDNLWNEVCDAAHELLASRKQPEMDALCAAVLKYGKATGQPGYAEETAPGLHLNSYAPEEIWGELAKGPAGVVESRTVWLKEMGAEEVWSALSDEQRGALDGMLREKEMAEYEVAKAVAGHGRRLDALEASKGFDGASFDSVLTRLEALENKAVPEIAKLEQRANRDLQRQISRIDDDRRSLQNHHERLSILEAAVNRLDVEEVDDERGRGVGQTGGAYERLEDVHRRLREEHSITSSALEIEKRRADKAEDHLKAILTGMPWEMVREFAEEPPF